MARIIIHLLVGGR